MKMSLAAAAVVIACAGPTVAHADVVIQAGFAGIVDDGTYTDSGPVNTSFVAGQPIAGSFTFDATTDTFLSFQIGGYTAAPGYTSIFSPPLASTPFVFLGVQNVVPNAAPADNLQINFYYETVPGPATTNIAAFIGNVGQFSQDLTSGSPSYFAAYVTNGDGSVTQVDGLLTSFEVPEPASLLIALPALAGLGLIRRRRG